MCEWEQEPHTCPHTLGKYKTAALNHILVWWFNLHRSKFTHTFSPLSFISIVTGPLLLWPGTLFCGEKWYCVKADFISNGRGDGSHRRCQGFIYTKRVRQKGGNPVQLNDVTEVTKSKVCSSGPLCPVIHQHAGGGGTIICLLNVMTCCCHSRLWNERLSALPYYESDKYTQNTYTMHFLKSSFEPFLSQTLFDTLIQFPSVSVR